MAANRRRLRDELRGRAWRFDTGSPQGFRQDGAGFASGSPRGQMATRTPCGSVPHLPAMVQPSLTAWARCWRNCAVRAPKSAEQPRPSGAVATVSHAALTHLRLLRITCHVLRVIASDINWRCPMSDVLIRDVPDDVLAAVESHAAKLGLSRNEYLRRQLAQDAMRSVAPVTMDDLRWFSDTFRRDHLGAYGNDRIHTPHLDRFAADAGVL